MIIGIIAMAAPEPAAAIDAGAFRGLRRVESAPGADVGESSIVLLYCDMRPRGRILFADGVAVLTALLDACLS